ncbi:MAG: alpha/beta fold hydrolase [Verrucomicrobiaceae bacterium]|nr:MAG: alpha/beta fold hydrolase [Verrucomicrobiaceae bacterium]
MQPLIWYIHGLQSTHRSFNFLKSKFPEHEYVDVMYDANESMIRLVETLVARIESQDRPLILVGHSLGGVIAAAVATRTTKVTKVATLSSPFGGSKVASLLRWMCMSPSLDNIHPHSALMNDIRRSRVRQPTLSVVTTGGSTPLIGEDNDGVVTVASQKEIKGPIFFERDVNHFEVLLCEDVAELLGGFLFE